MEMFRNYYSDLISSTINYYLNQSYKQTKLYKSFIDDPQGNEIIIKLFIMFIEKYNQTFKCIFPLFTRKILMLLIYELSNYNDTIAEQFSIANASKEIDFKKKSKEFLEIQPTSINVDYKTFVENMFRDVVSECFEIPIFDDYTIDTLLQDILTVNPNSNPDEYGVLTQDLIEEFSTKMTQKAIFPLLIIMMESTLVRFRCESFESLFNETFIDIHCLISEIILKQWTSVASKIRDSNVESINMYVEYENICLNYLNTKTSEIDIHQRLCLADQYSKAHESGENPFELFNKYKVISTNDQ